MTNPNSDMPNDPGAPEANDEQYVSPDQAEELAQEAAESQAFDAAEEPFSAASDDEIADALNELSDDADGTGTVSDIELQLSERTEDLQRVSAEYANYRRRTERERGQLSEAAKASFASQFLPLLDDLDLAEQHGDLNEGPLKVFAEKFRKTMADQKVVAFGAEGEAFNPEIHEAVQDLSTGDEKVIGTVLRKGYNVGDKLVRNAMVIIGGNEAESADGADGAEGSDGAAQESES